MRVPEEGGNTYEANRQTVLVYVSNVFLPGDEDDRGSGSFVVSPCVLTVISDRRSHEPGSDPGIFLPIRPVNGHAGRGQRGGGKEEFPPRERT